MGNIEITNKFYRLKSVSSIDHDYLKTATGGVVQKMLFFKFF